jgi:hypothetical protein
MPAVTESRLKGNYGAALVMSRLSGECLVRPVAADTDVGLDLYCETVAENRPFLHFWLQVRAGNQCRVDADKSSASCRFTLDHLGYWLRQPVPVFAALVPSEWPVRREPDIYIIDITTQLLTVLPGPAQETVTLSSQYCWPADNSVSVQQFLELVVPATTARLEVSKGVIAAAPTSAPQYVQERPYVPVRRFKQKILDQLRVTAALGILYCFDDDQPTSEDLEFRRLLARIVGQFDDDCHWETFFSRAVSSHADEDYSNAVVMYEKARQSIEGDPNVRNELSWQERVQVIERLKQTAAREYPLRAEELSSDYSGS